MRPLYIGKRCRHDVAEVVVECARTVGTIGCLGSLVGNSPFATAQRDSIVLGV